MLLQNLLLQITETVFKHTNLNILLLFYSFSIPLHVSNTASTLSKTTHAYLEK